MGPGMSQVGSAVLPENTCIADCIGLGCWARTQEGTRCTCWVRVGPAVGWRWHQEGGAGPQGLGLCAAVSVIWTPPFGSGTQMAMVNKIYNEMDGVDTP